MIRCGSFTEVTWVATGEKTKVWCQLDDSHACDHRGRVDYAGMMLSWPRVPTVPMIIRIDGSAPPIGLPQNPANAACLVKVDPLQGEDRWVHSPRGSVIADILAAAEHMRRVHIETPYAERPMAQPPRPWPSPYPLQDELGPKVRIE